jgi:hypothetical protein
MQKSHLSRRKGCNGKEEWKDIAPSHEKNSATRDAKAIAEVVLVSHGGVESPQSIAHELFHFGTGDPIWSAPA